MIIEINLEAKKVNVLKKILKKNDISSDIQNMVNDWFSNLIERKFNSELTEDQKVDELNKL